MTTRTRILTERDFKQCKTMFQIRDLLFYDLFASVTACARVCVRACFFFFLYVCVTQKG